MKSFSIGLIWFLVLIMLKSSAQLPVHFIPKGDPTKAMNINILEARFNVPKGLDLQAGDEIGIFDGNICCGVAVLTKSLGVYNDGLVIAAKAYGEDVGNDGFVTGHTISYRFWVKSADFECSAVVPICYNNQLVVVNCPVFDTGGSVFVQLKSNTCNIPGFPKPVNDFFSTNEDIPLTASAATNDVSTDTPNLWSKLVNPGHGSLVFNTDGSFTYTPVANFNGSDVFTYNLCDADGECASASVTIAVNPVDDFPEATTDYFITPEDTPLSGSVAGNDNPGGDGGYVWSKIAEPSHGILSLNGTGGFVYSPASNYYGQDSFVYQLCDADNDCDTAIVKITVSIVNDLPVANADVFITNEDNPCSGYLNTNDIPSGDGGNSWSIHALPSHGIVLIGTAGDFIFTPRENYNGTDSFVYKLCDSGNDCDTAIVKITILPMDDQPLAHSDIFTVDEDKVLTANLASNDSPSPDGGNVWNIQSQPAHGTASVQVNGTFTYTPENNYHGPDNFVYKICDADGDCDTAIVRITVLPIDELPVAQSDYYSAVSGMVLNGNVAINDAPSGDGGNIWTKETNAAHGTVNFNPSGTFSYISSDGFFGADSFIYKLCDSDGDCDTAIVKIIVTKTNKVPNAVNDFFRISEDTQLTASVAANDLPSGDGTNTWKISTIPKHGTASLSSDGILKYAPLANFSGKDTLQYELCDVDRDCTWGTVEITVEETDDFPIANADYYSVAEDSTLKANLQENDVLSGDGGNFWKLFTSPGHGKVEVSANGSFTFHPDVNYNGMDMFFVQLCDKDGDCDTSLVRIIITPVNDPPYFKTEIPDVNVNADRIITIGIPGSDPDANDEWVWTVTKDDGSPPPGFITWAGNTLTVRPLQKDEGCYNIKIQIIDKAGASLSRTFRLCVKVDWLGIDNFSPFKKVRIFPNPTSGLVKIVFEHKPPSGTFLTVHNPSGELILRMDLPEYENIVNLSGLSKGFYTLKITARNSESVQKLILN